jgi:hypothetical protein
MYHTVGVVGQIAFDLITFLTNWSNNWPRSTGLKKTSAAERP